MKRYTKSTVIIFLGLWITSLGLQMANAKMINTSETNTKGRNALIGAGIGAGGGIITGLIIGGIGIATGGTALLSPYQ